MSEYWKSTPTYWCKFCATYVRDTKQSRASHDATPRHQGAVQRSLRELHRTQDRAARDTQRAKDEVARLNGVVGGASAASAMTRPTASRIFTGSENKQADAVERKRQAAQLAAMGVAVPDALAKELGVAGEWQSVPVQRVGVGRAAQVKKEEAARDLVLNRRVKAENGEEAEQKLSQGTGVSFGVRKRVREDGDAAEGEENTLGEKERSGGWGQRTRIYPGREEEADMTDVAALLERSWTQRAQAGDGEDSVNIKKEEDVEGTVVETKAATSVPVLGVSDTATIPAEAVVFKKRRPKRQ